MTEFELQHLKLPFTAKDIKRLLKGKAETFYCRRWSDCQDGRQTHRRDKITNGTSMPRNSYLFNNTIYLLPYTGAGGGVKRALENGLSARFELASLLHIALSLF